MISDCIAMAFLDLFTVSVKSWGDMICMVMWLGGRDGRMKHAFALDGWAWKVVAGLLKWYIVQASSFAGCMLSVKIGWISYHRQYCRCDVTGRSGRATHSLRLSRFFLISSEMRMRVFSSLSSTEKPSGR